MNYPAYSAPALNQVDNHAVIKVGMERSNYRWFNNQRTNLSWYALLDSSGNVIPNSNPALGYKPAADDPAPVNNQTNIYRFADPHEIILSMQGNWFDAPAGSTYDKYMHIVSGTINNVPTVYPQPASKPALPKSNGAPSSVTASAASSSQINLSWGAVTGATGYQVERSANGSSGWATVGTPPGTSFQDTGLAANTTYYYRVRATAGGTTSAPSATVNAATQSGSTPNIWTLDDDGTGTGPSYTRTGPWTYYSGLANTYAYGGDTSDASAIGASATPTATATWTFTGLTPGYYRILGSWTVAGNRASDSPFTIKDGTNTITTVRMNQRNDSPTPAEYYDSNSRPWWRIGDSVYVISSNQVSVTLANNATSGIVVADAIRLERVDPTIATSTLDDDGTGTGPSYTRTGPWTYYSGLANTYAYGGDTSDASAIGASATPTATATWTFTGLTPGYYRILGSWTVAGNRASDSPFTIKDGTNTITTVRMNQRNDSPTPAEYYDSNSRPWWRIGDSVYVISSSQVSVTLANNATSGIVVADAIRLERVDPTIATPTLDDDGTGTGPSYTRTGPWTYYSGLANTYAYGGDTSDASAIGASATPTATATWTFTGLTPGYYRILGSWTVAGNRASDSPFTIKDGTNTITTVRMNQRNDSPTPAEYYDSNSRPWWRIGDSVYVISSSQVSVTLANNATSGIVVADAIRLEKVTVPSSGGMLRAGGADPSSSEVAAPSTEAEAASAAWLPERGAEALSLAAATTPASPNSWVSPPAPTVQSGLHQSFSRNNVAFRRAAFLQRKAEARPARLPLPRIFQDLLEDRRQGVGA